MHRSGLGSCVRRCPATVWWTASVVGVLLAAPGIASAHPPRFVERPGALAFSGQMIVRPVQAGELIVRGVARGDAELLHRRAGERLAAHTLEHVHATDEYIVAVPPGETENSYSAKLLATGDYEYAVPNWFCTPLATTPNDGGYWQQWHHDTVRSSLAWDLATGDSSVTVAIVDGGVEIAHPDFVGVVVPGYNADDRIAQVDGGDVDDVDGHGTAVAGLAGAEGNNWTHVVGMGWDFSVMPVRYYNTPGGGFLHNLLAGVRWAADNGATCINVSQTGVDNPSVQTTGAYVRSKGGLLFYAAGNDGRDLSWFDWGDVIVVGATDELDGKADFSAYGVAVDVYAPGTNMLSTGVPGVLSIGSGTSAATPIATGIAGLIWDRHPALSPGQVEYMLTRACVDLGDPGDDAYWGWGRVDAFGAVSSEPCYGDLTTQGAGAGDAGYLKPDGATTAGDINLYVNAWVAGDAVLADITTQGAGLGDAGYLVPDGAVTGADINVFVNLWVAGCP